MTENGKALAVREDHALDSGTFTREQVNLIKRTIAADATDDELKLFISQAERMGLDPFAKQIYFVKRQGKGTIQVGIDGYRLVADRTGKYAGNDDPEFEYDGEKPRLARVTVWKLVQGVRCPFTATARWSEYVPEGGQGFMWKRMPHVMLAKCAEALALRKAFPAELSGTYVDAEMDQAGEPVVEAKVVIPPPASPHNIVEQAICANCHKPIAGHKHGERFYNARTVAEKTRDRYGMALCWECADRLAAAERVTPDPTTGEMDGSEAAAESQAEF